MARYIDADRIILPKGFFERVDNVPKFFEWLDTQPTANVRENVHAHWDDCSNGWMCSFCNRYNIQYTPFCPYCGAQMDERRDDE